jgi:hypothetical protein
MNKAIAGMIIGTLVVTSMPVLAEHRDGRWESRDIHRFADNDLHIWRGGHWVHGRRDGRLGWWWVAAGIWYFYPAPVYPYPDPYTPSVTVINQPPVVEAPQAQPQSPPPPQVWYYCDSAKGYYPYVSSCPEPWRQVPAQPQQPAPN